MRNEEMGMSDNRDLYIEESIVGAAKRLLLGRVNELLGEVEDAVPPVEFGNYRGGSAAVGACSPAIALSTSERTEKERIIRVDAYSLNITFTLPKYPDGERFCYAYASSVDTALREDPTLGGVVDRAELTGKKYDPPKHSGTGGEWEIVLTLRITVEETGA
jgi:hypothetical protein